MQSTMNPEPELHLPIANSTNYFVVLALIIISLCVVAGVVGSLLLAVSGCRPRIIQQHPVCVYLVSISICTSIFLVLDGGLIWCRLFLAENPYNSSVFVCKFWSFLDDFGKAFIAWMILFALVACYLNATKSPRPAFCSLFGTRLTAGITAGVLAMVMSVHVFGQDIERSFHSESSYCTMTSISYNILFVIRIAVIYTPSIVALILCFVVGCSKSSQEVMVSDAADNITRKQLSRVFIFFSVVNFIIVVLYVSLSNVKGITLVLIPVRYVCLIITAYVCLAMVPALRQEIKGVCHCGGSGNSSGGENDNILMASSKKTGQTP